MKEYVDEKFWKMLSGFITLLLCSALVLISIKIYKNHSVEASVERAPTITSNQ